MFNSLSDTIILDLLVPEAVIVVSGLKGETSDSVSNHVLMEEQKENDSKMGKEGVTRVMLQKKQRRRSFTQTPDRVSGKSVSVDLIEIGCKRKNELGLAHFHCAEAWFKLRGNIVCEICGSSALNVPVRLTAEEWSEIRDTTTGEGRRRGSGQSCCIFMVFLLTIIVLHWFFTKMSGYYQNHIKLIC
ncbi:hypothetical protein YC2023_052689 [Brassica napus]